MNIIHIKQTDPFFFYFSFPFSLFFFFMSSSCIFFSFFPPLCASLLSLHLFIKLHFSLALIYALTVRFSILWLLPPTVPHRCDWTRTDVWIYVQFIFHPLPSSHHFVELRTEVQVWWQSPTIRVKGLRDSLHNNCRPMVALFCLFVVIAVVFSHFSSL